MHNENTKPYELETPAETSSFEVHAAAATFAYALLKNGFNEEWEEFTEWYLETFDHDLES